MEGNVSFSFHNLRSKQFYCLLIGEAERLTGSWQQQHFTIGNKHSHPAQGKETPNLAALTTEKV